MSHRIVRRAKRGLHYIAYGSLAVDVIVAFLTLALISHAITDPALLFVANLVLAVTVAITIGLCMTIIAIRWHMRLRKRLGVVAEIFSGISKFIRMNFWHIKARYRRWVLTRRRMFGQIF